MCVPATLKWTPLPLDGPSPACRLDFAMCTVKLRVPAETQETNEEMTATRINARDVLDSQLRLGSAGSGRSLGSVGSLGSAGSQRSSASSTGASPSEAIATNDAVAGEGEGVPVIPF